MNIAQLESDRRKVADRAAALIRDTAHKCDEAVTVNADGSQTTGRLMTKEERGAIDALLAEGDGLQKRIDAAKSDAELLDKLGQIGGGAAPPRAQALTLAGRDRLTVGQQFAEGVRAFIERGGHRGSGAWTSPTIECAGYLHTLQATTLTEGSGSGGPLIVPDYLPSIIPLNQRRPVVADLVAPGTTTSNLVQYMKEKTFTNAADAVKEGLAKPESALVYEAATAPVRKTAHWIPVSEEMLEDYAQIQSIIDARLRLGIALKEEDELLNGSGVDPHLLGLNTLPGLSPAVPMGTDTRPDAFLKQITAIATSTFIVPDGWIMNPSDWMDVQLQKNTQGNYMGTGPFSPPQSAMLWGLPGVVTPAQTAGIGLVGAFSTMAQIFRRGGVRVEASNSHQDFFIKNLVAIRGEERLAFAVYREAAFGQVTGI